MNNHMILLAFKFMLEIKGFTKDSAGKVQCEALYKKEVIRDVGELLAGGSVTAKQLQDFMDEQKDNPERESFYKPSSILDANNVSYVRKSYVDPNNLLVPGIFYFHPRLQVTPPPPVLDIQDDGTITASYDDEVFFLEIAERFTREDLVAYFYSKKNQPVPQGVMKRDIGAFDHMLRFWDVDFMLYLIDEAFAYSLDTGAKMPKTPLDIQQYETEAFAVYESRKNTSFEEGVDHVLPRAIT